MIKVCHVTSAHSRYDGRIFQKECTSLAKHGYEVYLLVSDDKENETINGVNIVSTKVNLQNRKERFLKLGKYIKKKVLEIDADIYHFHDPDLLFIANYIKKSGKKVIFDFHEDVPKQMIDKTWIPSLFRKVSVEGYKLLEEISVKNYDALVTVTPHVVERLKKINKNTILVTNYPILTEYEESNFDNNVCFAGGISGQWKHENIIEAIEDIPGIKYILAGKSPIEYMEELKSQKGWNKVEYKGILEFSKIAGLYKHSLLGVAINYSSQAKGEGTLGNTKLFEIMMAGIPVICSDYRLWKEIIDKYNCGITVNPNSVEEIRIAIRYLMEHKEVAKKMGKNGRCAVEQEFNWAIEEKKLIELYENLCWGVFGSKKIN